MQFSRATEYALLGLIYLAHDTERIASVDEIARTEKLSVYFLRNIFQKLKTAALVKSKRGHGYILAQPPQTISVRTILEAVEGPLTIHACLGDKRKPICVHSQKCKILKIWNNVQQRFLADLQRVKLANLI